MRFESFKLGAKCWLQSLNQCLSPHPWPACWSMMLQNPDMTGHTYIQETTYQIRHDSPLCAKSECSRLPVWSMLLKKSVPWNSCARILPSFFPGCVQCWSDSCEVLEVRSKPSASMPSCPAAGLFPGAARAHERGSPGQVLCFKAVQTAACPAHLAFLQASCNNFFLL